MRSAECRNICVACVEEIFLAEVAEFGAEFLRDREMIIDDEPDTRFSGDGQNCFAHAVNFFK